MQNLSWAQRNKRNKFHADYKQSLRKSTSLRKPGKSSSASLECRQFCLHNIIHMYTYVHMYVCKHYYHNRAYFLRNILQVSLTTYNTYISQAIKAWQNRYELIDINFFWSTFGEYCLRSQKLRVICSLSDKMLAKLACMCWIERHNGSFSFRRHRLHGSCNTLHRYISYGIKWYKKIFLLIYHKTVSSYGSYLF